MKSTSMCRKQFENVKEAINKAQLHILSKLILKNIKRYAKGENIPTNIPNKYQEIC